MSEQAPLVRQLPVYDDLPTTHHARYGTLKLPSGALKPIAFQNPPEWQSHGRPTLQHVVHAWRKGAAVAPYVPTRTPGPSRPPSPRRKGSVSSLQSGSLSRDEESAIGSDYGDGAEAEAVNEKQALMRQTSMFGRSVYVRPELSEWREDDEDLDWRDPPVEVVDPTWGGSHQAEEEVTWLGHAGVLVRIPWSRKGKAKVGEREDMCGVLFDPIFSYRCSPSQWVGPARYLPPPCTVAELPPIHVCCISHDHYDHLDWGTIADLWKHHSDTVHFFVPLGHDAWLIGCGIPAERITELDWWAETILTFSQTPVPPTLARSASHHRHHPAFTTDPSDDDADAKSEDAALSLKIACTPAQHRSGRGLLDQSYRLWGSWCVGVVAPADAARAEQPGMLDWAGFKVFFAGDTGYRYATAPEMNDSAVCPAFQQIADRYAPFSLGLLPVATGSSLPFLRTMLSISLDQYTLTSALHCSPADALAIHRVIRSERSIGVHWGTFCDADEARGTRVDFGRTRRADGVSGVWDRKDALANNDKGRFVLTDIGETLLMPKI